MSNYQITFGKPKHVTMESGQKFYSIPICREESNGEKGRLTFLTDKCFCWGPQKNGFRKDSDKKDYRLPICLISKGEDGKLSITEREKEFFELWNMLVKKEGIGRYDLEEGHLRRIGSCLWTKKDEQGKKVEDAAPFPYPELKINTKTEKVYPLLGKARIKRGEDSTLKLKDIEGQLCYLRAKLHFESIFVNSMYVSIQVKVLEAAIWPREIAEPSVIPIEVESEEEEDQEFDYYMFLTFLLFGKS